VLPIGGLKEKILAAKQAGVTKVLIPERNEKDLPDIPQEIKAGIEIVAVSHVEEVLRHALNLSQPESFMKVVGLKVLDSNTPPMEVAN
jgi:ATP-dependent Lon protease